MPTTSEVLVATTATPLPATTLTIRRSVLVENQGPNSIWVGHDPNTLAVGVGHEIAAGGWRSFDGAPLWGICTATQTGGAGNTTVVTEAE